MSDDTNSMDQNPARLLVFTFGGIFTGAGIGAMLTSQINWLSVNSVVVYFGVILMLLAAFWKKVHFDKTEFATKLNKIASHPSLWIAIVTAVWLSMIVLNALKEIRENNQIVALRNDVQSMARVIDRGVMPRHLSKRQQSTISNFLSQFESHEFSFQLPNRDEEAGGYRSDIEQALEKGGWYFSAQNPYDYRDDVPEGLSLDFMQSPKNAQKPDEPQNPKPARLLMMALGLAAVRLDRFSTGGTGVNVTTDRLVISIGHRRMDSNELTPPDNSP
jgi:NADH:ubiquinone oxidoreductase subunit 6 (subunit J)